MTKLNKIIQVMVIAGVAQISMSAFAADIGVSQSISVSNKTEVLQSTSTESGQAKVDMNSDASAESSTQVDANAESASPTSPEQPSSDEDSSDGSAESDDSNSEDAAAKSANEDEQKANTSSLDMDNIVKIEAVKTTTVEAFTKLSEVSGNLVAETSDNLSGQLTSTSALTITAALEPALLFNSDDNQSAESVSDTDGRLTQNQDSDVLLQETDEQVVVEDDDVLPEDEGTELLAQDTALNAAAELSSVVEKTIQTSLSDSITSNTQNSVSESVNSQISTLVSEQINNEITAATAAEVASTIANDLSLGL
jgi:hypothetical protein